MSNLRVIMPMAGEGSRFKKEGYIVPKPLLEIDNKYFFEKALESLQEIVNKYDEVNYTFVVRKEHIDNNHIDILLKNKYENCNIIYVEKTTRGAAETCMLAKDFINDNESIIVLDCDLFARSYSFENSIKDLDSDGAVLSFNSNSPKYSYALTDENNNIIKTAEKNPISNNALTGVYFFRTGGIFKKYASRLIKENDVKNIKEYYISLIYNKMIEDGLTVKLFKLDEFKSFGTPEEYLAI